MLAFAMWGQRDVGFNRMGFVRIEPEIHHETTKERKGLLALRPDVWHFVFSSFRTFVILGVTTFCAE